MVDDTHAPVAAAPASQHRRVLTETEVPEACSCLVGEEPECPCCNGVGTRWKVTSRTVQVGSTFEEQAAYAIIQGLHAHIRKAAATVEQAAGFLEKAGQTKQARGMRDAAKAILEPVEGQD